jgi:hypothetical protein
MKAETLRKIDEALRRLEELLTATARGGEEISGSARCRSRSAARTAKRRAK